MKVVDQQYDAAIPLAALTEHPENPRRGDDALVGESIDALGFFGAILVQRSTGHIVAGNTRYRSALARGADTVPGFWIDCDDDTARRILLVDNRASDVALYDDLSLIEVLSLLRDTDAGLLGTGYDEHDLDSLLQVMGGYDDHAEDLAGHDASPPARRELPVRAIICASLNPHIAPAVHLGGFMYGTPSHTVRSWLRLQEQVPAYVSGHRLAFMDNEWHDYNHAEHVAAVEATTPIAATVRDIMTRTQCEEAGVEFYPLAQVLDMAAEVAQHTDEVVLIPKYDCLDKLPRQVGQARVVLGYSVPSRYGATPVAPEMFRGWPVHLLGGTWKQQQRLLHELGDDVVSLDTNAALTSADYLQFIKAGSGGRSVSLAETLGLDRSMRQRGLYAACVVLSLIGIAADLHAWNGRQLGELLDDDRNANPEGEPDDDE